MDPDNYCRRRFAVMFCVLSIFLVTVTFATASTARENAAGSREQSDNAY
jgi:biopolymer transport protein ExbD